MERTLIIINQKAGRGTPGPALLKILNVYSSHGLFPEVYLTQSRGDAYRKAKELAGAYDRIVCYGGDGTLDEVAAGIMKSGSQCTIGYIPAGSTNDFGNSLKLSKDAAEAAETTISGKEFMCDIGTMNGKYFAYVAAFGAFTEVSYKTDQDMKNILGHTAYILEGAKSLMSIKAHHMVFTMDDEVVEGDFIFGMVSNSASVGGFKGITGRDIEFDDGVFEVVLVKKTTNPIELQRVVTALLFQKEDDLVYFRKVSRLSVMGDEASWTLDGEDGGVHSMVEVLNHKQKMSIMVPDDQQDLMESGVQNE